jgi:hypothetical protein
MLVISLSLLHKTRDTPNRVNREVSKILRCGSLAFIKEGRKIVTKRKTGKELSG